MIKGNLSVGVYEVEEILKKQRTIKYINVSLSTTEKLIEHKLKRVPVKWAVVKNDAPFSVFGTDDEVYLRLKATGDCNVTLEVM